MARLFRDRGTAFRSSPSISTATAAISTVAPVSSADLPSPFGQLGCSFSDKDLRETAYEIFVAACRATGGKPLTYIPRSEMASSPPPERTASLPNSFSSLSFSSSGGVQAFQRSLTSTAASKMKKALGMRSSSSSEKKKSSPSRSAKRSMTAGEVVRVQMGISEQTDSRIRRGLLRVAAGQLGRRIESMVLPLELLQQYKASDFPDEEEYEAWQAKTLKVLEAGLLLHPHLSLDKSDAAAQQLRKIIRGASERPVDTGKNSETMQVLYSAVMTLACRSFDGFASETCHWADGFPLNLHLYQMLLEACFDNNEEGSIIEEIDEVLELIKRTWVILGVDQMLHNLCFTWVLFCRFVATGQTDTDLLSAADNQLTEVSSDAKTTKDPIYSKILSSTLSSISRWSEKQLLAYHETFHAGNVDLMFCIVSLGVSAAKILVEDTTHEYRRKRREEVDVARNKIDMYIRSSLRTAFAQRMEQADSSIRISRSHANPTPVLSILAKDIGDLANKEKDIFGPILKKWHPLAAGVAVATLHACYGNELRQFISGITELTPDSIQVLRAADKLEKDLVQVAVEDAVDSEDGGKAIIREMPPYEAESVMANLTRTWIKSRLDRLKEWVDRSLQKEIWNLRANKENFAPAVEVLQIVSNTVDAFLQLPIPMHAALFPDLITGIDRCLPPYLSKAKAGCGTRKTFIPALPALTRCSPGSKIPGMWKKKEKSLYAQKRKPQVGTVNGDSFLDLPQLCVRMNTLHQIRLELANLEKRIVNHLKSANSSQIDIANGLDNKFELSLAACQEGLQQLYESTAYRTIFVDLNHVLLDSLYVGETAVSRIEPLLKELDPMLEMISSTLHDRVRNRVITALMKVSFDGFLLVLLAGGPSRAFSRQDSQIIEDDFRYLKNLFLADGDGLPEEVVEKASTQARAILPLFRTETESLIERYRNMIMETYGPAAKLKFPLPPTSGHWNPTEPNTILRVLCYRNDEAASKFLKKTYNLPKKS